MLNKSSSRGLFLFITVLMNSVFNLAIAETRIGFVDTPRILKEAPQAEAAHKKLKTEFDPRDKKIVSLQKELRKLEDELAKNTSLINDEIRKNKERKIISDKRDIKRAKEEFNEDFNIRRNEELSKLQKLIYETIVMVSKSENFDIVLGDSVIYKSERVDLTEQVLKRLKTEFNKAHPENSN